MDRGRKLDIEPLSEQRWARIERRLFERVESEPQSAATTRPAEPLGARWRMAAAMMMAGAGAAVLGAVAWHALSASPHDVALAPSRITTEATGSHVNVGEAALDLAPRSAVAVSGDDAHGVTVQLEQGRVECEVPPRHGRPPFAVEAGDVLVRVIGTHFAVQRDGSDVEVEVQRGIVRVTRGEQRVDVRAGETWPPATNAGAPGAASTASEPAAPPEPSTPSAPAASPAAPAAAPSPREVYDAASRLEASRPERAIALYRDLAARGGPWGMNALFAQGRLEADRGHTAEARRVLEEYLARYPSGPNANDARQLLDRLR